jgi:predicted AlkP superfamily pyrophosphatase or phosphodiesterase
MNRLLLLACLLLAACTGSPRLATAPPAARPPVILISVDGLRPD